MFNINVSFAVLCEIIFGCTPSLQENHNQLSKQEIEEGWELLFDGKTFNGWRGLGRNTAETNNWKVENGGIHKIDSRLVASLPNGEKSTAAI